MKLEKIQKYTTYEYLLGFPPCFDNVVIVAYVEEKDGENWLNISLKTSENSGTVHFVVGFKIDSNSELRVSQEIMRLAENGYFHNFVFSSLEEEEVLEEYYCEMLANK